MKKSFYILAAMLAFAACSKPGTEGSDPEPDPTPTEATSIQISATNPFGWVKADKVSIFDGKANNLFRSQGAGETAVLAGEALPIKPLYGFTPYDEAASLKGGVVSASVPAAQVLTAGKSAGVAAGYSEDGKSMTFSAVTGFLKIDLAADAENITAISVASNGGEALAGPVEVSFAGGKATVTPKSEVATVSLTAFEETFKAGSSYYVAVLPGTYANGLTVYFTFKGAVNELAIEKSVTVAAGQTVELANIERPLTAVEKLLIGEWELSKWGSGSWLSTNLGEGKEVPESVKGDVIKFNLDGTVEINLGEDGATWNVSEESAPTVELTGEETWSLAEGETVLKLSGKAFPLILGNAEGLTTDYTISRISAAEMVLEYLYTDSEGTPDVPFKIYLQPKGMKRFYHAVTPGDWGIDNVDGEGVLGEDGLKPLVIDGISWTLKTETQAGGVAPFGWFAWGALRVGAWAGDDSIKTMTLSTSDIKGNIKAVNMDVWHQDEFTTQTAEFSVTVGGKPFGSKSPLKGESTGHSATSTEPASGEIVISVVVNEGPLAFILRNFEVVYQD